MIGLITHITLEFLVYELVIYSKMLKKRRGGTQNRFGACTRFPNAGSTLPKWAERLCSELSLLFARAIPSSRDGRRGAGPAEPAEKPFGSSGETILLRHSLSRMTESLLSKAASHVLPRPTFPGLATRQACKAQTLAVRPLHLRC